jgi:histidine kinase
LITIQGYEALEVLVDRPGFVLYRAQQLETASPVLLKVYKKEQLSLQELTLIENEFEFSRQLDYPWVLKPIELIRTPFNVIQVWEGFPGVLMSQWISLHQNVSLRDFLKDAVRMVSILDQLHGAGYFHGGIDSDVFLIHPESGQFKCMRFDRVASIDLADSVEALSGFSDRELCYISPEQTGRMNIPVTYQTDFYSLGILLYEYLVGKVPFESENLLDLIYSHIAKLPTPIEEIRSDVPEVVSNIILKCLAKNADDRYKSMHGLKQDFEACLDSLEKTNAVRYFAVGESDRHSRFSLNKKLYGRDKHRRQLMAIFDKSISDVPQLVFITGTSGIGKTSLVYEIQKPVLKHKGFFAKGKFDQFEREVPYFGFVRVIQDLIGQVVAEGPESIALWQDKMATTLGNQFFVILDIIPDLETLIARPPVAEKLNASDAQLRFHLEFYQVIRTFAHPDHPLVVFLDDIQWADSESLHLLEFLISDQRMTHLMIIGSYRHNEVSQTHPVGQFLKRIEALQIVPTHIHLEEVDTTSIRQLIVDSFVCDLHHANRLAELIFEKTQGNPFFVRQFIQYLFEHKLMLFSGDTGMWEWDFSAIEHAQVTDNVVDFLSQKIRTLGVDTQSVLKTAACIGSVFNIEMLFNVSGLTFQHTSRQLLQALRSSFVVTQGKNYKILESFDWHQVPIGWNEIDFECHFLHDKVYEAAYQLLDADEMARTHFSIGCYWLSRTPESQLRDVSIDIVTHLNRGLHYALQLGSVRLAELNLLAARKAKSNAAYDIALAFFIKGVELLGEQGWVDQYALMYPLSLGKAECEYLCKKFDQAEKSFAWVLDKAQNHVDKVNVLNTVLIEYTNTGRYREALEVGNRALKLLKRSTLNLNPSLFGVGWEMIKVFVAMQFRPIRSLARLPKMTTEESLLYIRILNNLGPPAYFISQNLMSIIPMKMVGLSLRSGNASVSPFGYSSVGIVLGPGLGELLGATFGWYSIGYKFGTVALEANAQFSDKVTTGRSQFIFGAFIHHWKKPLRLSLNFLRTAYELCNESGDFIWAGYATCAQVYALVSSGEKLEVISKECDDFITYSEQTKHEDILYDFLVTKTWIRALEKSDPFDVDPVLLQKVHSLARTISLHLYYYYAMMIYYLFGNLAQAHYYANLSQKLLDSSVGFVYTADHYFFKALILSGKSSLTIYEKAELWRISHKFKIWSTQCKENFYSKHLLIQAEIARLKGKPGDALFLYEQAISEAKLNRLIHVEAIANECLGKFYLSKAIEMAAQHYLNQAYRCYQTWGAFAKATFLTQRYPNFFGNQGLSGDGAQDKTLLSGNDLDMAGLISTIQHITGERNLKQLQKEIMQIMVQVAGGQRGIVVIKNADQFEVQAAFELKSDNRMYRTLKPIALREYKMAAKSVINHVIQYKKECILDDARQSKIFEFDPYIREKAPRSILCIPLVKQDRVMGVIYLENNVATHAFSQGRLKSIEILAGQMAIALENAQMYEALTKREQTLEREVEKESSAKRKAMSAAQELSYQASFSTLTLGIAHEIRNPLSAMQSKAVHMRDRLTGSLELNVPAHIRDLVFRDRVTFPDLLHVVDQQEEIATSVWNTLTNALYLEPDGHFNERKFKPFSPYFELEFDPVVKPFETQVITYLMKTYLDAQILFTMDVFIEESARVERICDNMLEYGISGKGVSKSAFAHIVEADQSERVWELLVEKGFLDEKGMILDRFDPSRPDFSLQLGEKYAPYEPMIIEVIDQTDKAKKARIDLNKTALDLCSLYEGKFKQSGIQIYTELSEELNPILGHFDDLKQALMNMFANAAFAMNQKPEGEKRFTIRTLMVAFDEKEPDRLGVELQIEDTGCGIPKSVMPKIMDPFFSTKGLTGGKNIGLGLAIVNQTIHRFGGKIIVESEEGKGTLFRLIFPAFLG